MLRFRLIFVCICGVIYAGICQKAPVQLKFTGTQLSQHIEVDSIVIHNLNQQCDTVLFWPDTVLNLISVGVEVVNSQPIMFGLNQNIPNPFFDQTTFTIFTPENGELMVYVTELTGQKVAEFHKAVNPGLHEFSFIPGGNHVYIVTAEWFSMRKSIKLLCLGNNCNEQCILTYKGRQDSQSRPKQTKTENLFTCALGDIIKIVGYKDSVIAVLKTCLLTNANLELSFGLYPPCQGLTEINYSGQKYFTVKIGNQCWMRENLNTGTMVNSINTGTSHTECSNNSLIEKYCFDNNPLNCELYGAFYDWDEMMAYQTTAGVQGICPPGFHIPTDNDWVELISNLGGEWVAGGKLKEAGSGNWLYPNSSATNESGFTAIPSGFRTNNGSFLSQKYYSYFWSSTENANNLVWNQYIYYNNAAVYQSYDNKKFGYAVRCIME